MTGPQRLRARALFEALVDRPLDAAYRELDSLAADDDAVRMEVRSLLVHHAMAGAFLETPACMAVESDEVTLPAGTALGPYVIVRELGSGGMGRVYLATDTRLRRSVCLKVVREEVGDETFRARLKHEARTAAALSHPGICAVYALEEFDGALYLVTEFIDGRTLRAEIAEGARTSAAQVVQTLRDLADAVAAAHARGITHRDLKPENVMRTSDGRLKVLDFGLARFDGPVESGHGATLPGLLIGTPGYMAPEQIDGGVIGPPTDVFALGVLAFELATGVHPFAAATPIATAARVLGETPEPLAALRPDLPGPVAEVIERCLAKRPEDRPASAAALVAALAAAAAGDPPALPPDRRSNQARDVIWWRIHQICVVGVYAAGAGAAWKIHDWQPGAAARTAFLTVGILAVVGGVIRGHMLFTERTNPGELPGERRRTRSASLALDIGLALALLADATLLSPGHLLIAALVMGLAAGLGTAAVLIEPATSRSTIGVP